MRPSTSTAKTSSKRGQAITLLLAIILAMVALTLWVTSIRSTVIGRLRSQDGGDAAALAAARWQAAGLNLCGELNLIQAYMLADDVDNIESAQALHELRQRVQLTTPILAALAAQKTAEVNEMDELPGAEEYLREVRDHLFLEGYYEGAEQDLKAMLSILIESPIYAFPLSPVYDTTEQANLLVEQDFYEAVLGRDWCWFWFNAYAFLQRYNTRADFGQLPNLNMEPFYGLHLGARQYSLEEILSHPGNLAILNHDLARLNHPTLPNPPPPDGAHPALFERPAVAIGSDASDPKPISWTTYDNSHWGPWTAMHEGELPIEGTLREGYDYKGTSAAVSVSKDGASWLAVAKPFSQFRFQMSPSTVYFVHPEFNDVRLIPVDAGEPGIRGFDVNWLRHLRNHVPDYVSRGFLADGCRYCTALSRWQDPAFRHEAIEWLAQHGNTCRRPRPGSGPDGGAHYAH